MSVSLASPAIATFERRRAELLSQRRRATLLYGGLLLLALLVSAWVSEVSPAKIAEGIPRFGEYFAQTIPHLTWQHLFAGTQQEGSLAYWFYRLDEWAWLLLQTANIAAFATLLGAAIAFVLAFLAARNVATRPWLAAGIRRLLEGCRTVPEIVFALIFVWAFGIGPLAGILAIALHTIGALGKLFAEVIENADLGAADGVKCAGGNWVQQMRFGVLPGIAPNLLSYAILRFEINVRGASVIGFVGAGGIGQELYAVIAQNYYEEISAIVVLIIVTVALIDLGSERLRRGLTETTR
ncbi:phosphonate ABC transporter, permease protein PhnE [Falsiroseomonas oryziterrae]|uniref:phosphonate ABC transporter, permease protein PhnE n=1 Tax=Falsiroseomonas oryziterrae TaxID=2911368 RepID=UPI001EFF811B|nr:phosphonate ABC transporter, permease protein PhnE [Roseomonas sp. NPKOSM-4]